MKAIEPLVSPRGDLKTKKWKSAKEAPHFLEAEVAATPRPQQSRTAAAAAVVTAAGKQVQRGFLDIDRIQIVICFIRFLSFIVGQILKQYILLSVLKLHTDVPARRHPSPRILVTEKHQNSLILKLM